MDTRATIYVAGSDTLIGAAIGRELARHGYTRVVNPPSDELDLTDSTAVAAFFADERPEYVFFAAGRSGGIRANQKYPAELMRDNLLSATNVIHNAQRYGAQKLLYLASSCSYPRETAQPMRPEALLAGRLEPTNEAYAMAKLAGLTLCKAYRQQYGARFVTAIPADAFGPGDDFTPEDSHVVAALMLRMHEARLRGDNAVEVWGTGTPRREFIFVDDLADACIFVMNTYDDEPPINLGGGSDLSISELAACIKDVVGFEGALRFDTTRPDGMPMKRLDATQLIGMGWRPRTPFREGLARTYAGFVERRVAEAARV